MVELAGRMGGYCGGLVDACGSVDWSEACAGLGVEDVLSVLVLRVLMLLLLVVVSLVLVSEEVVVVVMGFAIGRMSFPAAGGPFGIGLIIVLPAGGAGLIGRGCEGDMFAKSMGHVNIMNTLKTVIKLLPTNR